MEHTLVPTKSDLKDILISGLAGTTTMTTYSYLLARKKKDHFREPQLLNYLIHGKDKVKMGPIEKSKQPATGFLLHYGVGTLFSSCYHLFWKKKIKTNAWKNGLAFGLTFGLIGISVWKTVFKIHPHPPKIDLNNYLGHLIVAHLIFGATVALSPEVSGKMEMGG